MTTLRYLACCLLACTGLPVVVAFTALVVGCAGVVLEVWR